MTTSPPPTGPAAASRSVPIWKKPLSHRQVAFLLPLLLLPIAAVSLIKLRPHHRPADPTAPFPSPPSVVNSGPIPGHFHVAPDAYSLIPKEQIHAGGPPKDGIPALTHPDVIPADQAETMQPDDRVIGLSLNGEARAYPLRILNWHEIINDTLGEQHIAVTYCPLCDSALVFDRTIGGQTREFGVSGLLYNSNVLMYDRQDGDESKESLWSQMMFKAVVGPAAVEGLELTFVPAQLVTWQTWLDRNPQTTVTSFDTGHSRDYAANPYSDYFTSERLMFPVEPVTDTGPDETGIPAKDPVIILSAHDTIKGYPASRLRAALGSEASTVTDTIGEAVFTFEAIDPERGIYRVTDEEGADAAAAFSFWFEFRAAHPAAEVFDPSA